MLLEKIEKEISAKNAEKELRIKKENELFGLIKKNSG